jgi:hypothetical protein
LRERQNGGNTQEKAHPAAAAGWAFRLGVNGNEDFPVIPVAWEELSSRPSSHPFSYRLLLPAFDPQAARAWFPEQPAEA